MRSMINNSSMDYFQEAKQALQSKIYRGSILLSAAAIEARLKHVLTSMKSLSDRLECDAHIRLREPSNEMDLIELIWWARWTGFFTNDKWECADWIRELRNAITHPPRFLDWATKDPRASSIAKAIHIYGPSEEAHDEIKIKVAFKMLLPKFAEEAVTRTQSILNHLDSDLSLPGTRQVLDQALETKYRDRLGRLRI